MTGIASPTRGKTFFGPFDTWTLMDRRTGELIYSTHRGMGEAREALEIVRRRPMEEALKALKRLAKEGV